MDENPDSYDSLMARAVAKINARDYHGAATLLENALRIRSTSPVWQLLGLTWKECAENAKAREALLKVVELKPQDSRAWVNLGAIELDLRLFAEAAEHYKRAVELEPGRADLRIWLANAYDRAGSLPNALESYRQAEALESSNAEVFYERALAYRNHGRFRDAARHFRHAYELDPSRENALVFARQMAVAPHQVPADADPGRRERPHARPRRGRPHARPRRGRPLNRYALGISPARPENCAP
jgi:tetratricopeptide (TPR) repeat protein